MKVSMCVVNPYTITEFQFLNWMAKVNIAYIIFRFYFACKKTDISRRE